MKTLIISVTVALVVGAAGGYYFTPTKVEQKIVIQKEQQKNNDVVTITVETIRPDGTIERHTEKVDKSTIISNKTTEGTKITTKEQNSLMLRALFAGDVRSGTLAYGLGIDKRVLGPLYIGVWGLNSGTIGASVSLGF